MPDFSAFFESIGYQALYVFLYALRVAVPLVALIVVIQCYRSVKIGRRPQAPVMMLEEVTTHAKFPVLYWENSIGRSRSCDVSLPDATLTRDHAVLMRRELCLLFSDTFS